MSIRFAALILVVGLAGCSGYAQVSPRIGDAMAREDFPGAMALVEKISRSNSELLYCYERAMVLRAQGDFVGSNQSLERAEQVIDELYTRSVTRELASLTVSETITQYRGDAFEAVLVNYFKILNYLDLKDVDGALVECRRLNHRLQVIHDAGETYFVDDPFLQYLTALVYEIGGEPESAEVSYRTAAACYRELSGGFDAAPPWMHCDARDNALARGDPSAAAAYDSLGPCAAPDPSTGRVTVLIQAGRVVRKLESNLVLPIFQEDDCSDREAFAHELATRRDAHYSHTRKVKYWLRISLPVLEARPPDVAAVVVRATPRAGAPGDPVEVPAVVAEDVDAQATRAYKEKESTVLMRAIIRALGKYLASTAANHKDEALGAIVNLIGVATETADTRSWTTLPQAILIGRLELRAGAYQIDADVVNAAGRRVDRMSLGDVDVRAGVSIIRDVRMPARAP